MLKVFKRWAAEHLISEQRKPQSVKDLKYEFTDSNGMRYYSWGNELDKVPTNRESELIGLSMWAEAKISPETLETISEEINKLNFELIKTSSQDERNRKHSRITVLCNELKDRKTYAIPQDIVLAMTAVLCVREDENPNVFSSRIQDEKLNQFKVERSKGNDFFLNLPTLKGLLRGLIGTDVNVNALSLKWAQDEQRQSERLKTILQDDASKSTTNQNAK